MATKVDEHRVYDIIVDRLNDDSRVDAAHVKVDVTRHGTVMLRGTVPNFHARHAAEEVARGVAGVQRVDNFLVVPLPDPAELTEPNAPGDDGLRARVNQYLRGQDILDAERIDVIVENGIVTLEGNVNAFWKRRRTEEVVLGVDGVRDIISRLTVVPTHKADDEELAAHIMERLAGNTILDAQTIDVKVNNALVTLRGTVPSRLAKWEAYQIALWAEGVTDVRDELEIVPA